MPKIKMYLTVIMVGMFFGLLGGWASADDMQWKWAQGGGGAGYDGGNAVTTDQQGNIYVVGYYGDFAASFGPYTFTNSGTNDVFVAKYDSGGNLLRAQKGGGTGQDEGMGIAVDQGGNVYIVGYYGASVSFGPYTLMNSGGNDAFIVKYDSGGNVLRAQKGGGINSDVARGVALDQQGNVYVANNTNPLLTKYDSGGNLLRAQTGVGGSNGIDTDLRGNVYVANNTNPLLTKYDSGGNLIWSQMGVGTYPSANGVVVDQRGNAYMVGFYYYDSVSFGPYTLTNTNSGNSDIFIVKYDSGGNVLWAHNGGGTGYDNGYSVDTDPDGNVYIAGYFDGPTAEFGSYSLYNNGYYTMYVVGYDSDGNIVLAKQSDANSDYAQGMTVDYQGNIYAVGAFENATASFGEYALTNSGDANMVLVKLGLWDCMRQVWLPWTNHGLCVLPFGERGNSYSPGNIINLSFDLKNLKYYDLSSQKFKFMGHIFDASALSGTATGKMETLKVKVFVDGIIE